MSHPYDSQSHDPPAPVLSITARLPGDSRRQISTDALVDTGSDITCLPAAIISALGAVPARKKLVRMANGKRIGPFNTYVLDFEVADTTEPVEVLGLGDEPLLGRNLINAFALYLDGPAQELKIQLANQ